MSNGFTITINRHDAFGLLATLAIFGQPARRFTCQEALIVSRALAAVAVGASAERQIYMSPIASDHDFEAQVREDGIALVAAGYPEAKLEWGEARRLSRELASFGRAPSGVRPGQAPN